MRVSVGKFRRFVFRSALPLLFVKRLVPQGAVTRLSRRGQPLAVMQFAVVGVVSSGRTRRTLLLLFVC